MESDTNIPSGESLVRQFLYGRRYFKDVFGQDSKVLWLPDVFGYSAALPQIAKKSGIDYFMTTKISWNQYNHFPHDTFYWRGIDGTELLTHFITTSSDAWFYTYNGVMNTKEITGIWQNYKQKEINDQLLLSFGHGDGGGGPMREMLETRRALANIPGVPYVKTGKAEPYFEMLHESLKDEEAEYYEGELYFEYHRGTLTSQAYNKKANRQMENHMHNLELVYCLAKLDYPKAELDKMWERILLLQFHDIIPGSSIHEVYEDSRKDYEELLKKAEALLSAGIDGVIHNDGLGGNMLMAINTLSFERDENVFVPYSSLVDKHTSFQSEGGALAKQETEGGLLVHVTNIPPLGYKTFVCDKGKNEDHVPFVYSESSIDTPFYEVKLNDMGEFQSLYDKEAKRQVGRDCLNRIEFFEDKPLNFDAWDIDVFYKEKPLSKFARVEEVKVSEAGTLRLVLTRRLVFNQSVIKQDIIFYASSLRIDFVTDVEWSESQVLVKAAFPLDIRASNARYDIQFGHIDRPNHSNDVQDFAKFEVCGHKWAMLSEPNYSVALMNNCKYGYDCKDSVMRLTLIKSPIDPDRTADKGRHQFTYSLYPHMLGNDESDVARAAMELNQPLLTRIIGIGGQCQSSAYSFASVVHDGMPAPNVVVDTVKRAEDDSDIILRVFENSGRRQKDVRIRVNDGFRLERVSEVNLIEYPLPGAEFEVKGQEIRFDILPFEIRTFKVRSV